MEKVEIVLRQKYMSDEGQDKTEAMVVALQRELKIARSALTSDVATELEMTKQKAYNAGRPR